MSNVLLGLCCEILLPVSCVMQVCPSDVRSGPIPSAPPPRSNQVICHGGIGAPIWASANIAVTQPPPASPRPPSHVCDVIRGTEVTVHQSGSSLLLDNSFHS